ncbi:hypothetical protein Tco_0815111 [Tanacetum coccineum]
MAACYVGSFRMQYAGYESVASADGRGSGRDLVVDDKRMLLPTEGHNGFWRLLWREITYGMLFVDVESLGAACGCRVIGFVAVGLDVSVEMSDTEIMAIMLIQRINCASRGFRCGETTGGDIHRYYGILHRISHLRTQKRFEGAMRHIKQAQCELYMKGVSWGIWRVEYDVSRYQRYIHSTKLLEIVLRSEDGAGYVVGVDGLRMANMVVSWWDRGKSMNRSQELVDLKVTNTTAARQYRDLAIRYTHQGAIATSQAEIKEAKMRVLASSDRGVNREEQIMTGREETLDLLRESSSCPKVSSHRLAIEAVAAISAVGGRIRDYLIRFTTEVIYVLAYLYMNYSDNDTPEDDYEHVTT